MGFFKSAKLFQALFSDVLLQSGYLLSSEFDSTSEGEIIPFSVLSKSGAGCIIHAGGGGLLRAGGVELLADFTTAAAEAENVAGLGCCYKYAARMLSNEAETLEKATDLYLLRKAEIEEALSK